MTSGSLNLDKGTSFDVSVCLVGFWSHTQTHNTNFFAQNEKWFVVLVDRLIMSETCFIPLH